MTKVSWLRRVSNFGTTFGMTTLMAGFGLTGIASAQTITNTGPGSYNKISSTMTNNCEVRNNTRVAALNNNYQTAYTGSADVSGNTSAGGSWDGWARLDPHKAQADGVGYGPWRDGVVNWMSQHASGQGWNSTADNTGWMPSGDSWSSYDPGVWQANGQSFGNWYNGTQSYMDTNSPVWALSWPADATGSSNFGGATSGNASNNNGTNFSITINNAARKAAGVNACGQSNFTPPPCNTCGGGMGGGPSVGSVGSVDVPVMHQAAAGGSGGVHAAGYGSSGVGSNFGNGSFVPAVHHGTSAVTAPMPGSMPLGGAGGGTSTPCAPSTPTAPSVGSNANISNTGPDSTNKITSTMTNNSTVRNDTVVSFTSSNTQKASTGDATVSGNTWASGAGSGYTANDNGTGTVATVQN